MRSLVVVLGLALAGCAGSRGATCSSDGDCEATLACLTGRCAPALEDPGGPSRALGGPVRVIAVGLHPTLADVETQASWEAFVRGVFTDDVLPRLASDRPNLIVLPENTALTTAFIGQRGEAARRARTAAEALGEVLGGWSVAAQHYSLRSEVPLAAGRLVGLAVTDTTWRALAVFAELAAELDAWVVVSTNAADAERTTDPALITALVDEAELDRSFAWVAPGHDVHNQALLWDPEGVLVHQWRKVYLVPDEESADLLALSFGRPEALRPYDAPFGRIAALISKDAWMPDVLDRLAADDAALLLQPEAFSGWGIPHGDDATFAPDVVKESAWAHVMRYPSFAASAMPCLSQNLFELVFDCQSAVVVGPERFEGEGAFIGQDPDAGFAAVAPWVIEDDRVGSIDERRARLYAAGAELVPGGANEDGYVASAVHQDLDLSRAEASAQRGAAMAWTDSGPVVFFEDDRGGQTRIYGSLGSPRSDARVRVRTDSEVRALRVASHWDRVALAWQEARDGGWDVRYALSDDGGRSFGEPSWVGSAGPRREAPDVALDASDGTLWLAWIEIDAGPARVQLARVSGGALALVAVDPATPGPYRTRENRWAPTIVAARGRVAVAWADFRAFRWEIWGAVGDASGLSAAARLDDYDGALETLHTDPRLAWLDDGTLVLAWTDLRVRRPDHDVRVRRLREVGSALEGEPSVRLASTDGAGRPQWRPSLAASGSRVFVAWQDLRGRTNEVRFSASDDGGRTFADDQLYASGYAPTVAMRDGEAWIAWALAGIVEAAGLP